MPIRLTLRLDFSNGHRLGPGKVRLLEAIDQHGSISAAGRALGMSYRRAWLLVDEINRAFTQPAVAGQTGGSGGGGTALTDWGRELVTLYRELEAASAGAGSGGLERIDAMLNPVAATEKPVNSQPVKKR